MRLVGFLDFGRVGILLNTEFADFGL